MSSKKPAHFLYIDDFWKAVALCPAPPSPRPFWISVLAIPNISIKQYLSQNSTPQNSLNNNNNNNNDNNNKNDNNKKVTATPPRPRRAARSTTTTVAAATTTPPPPNIGTIITTTTTSMLTTTTKSTTTISARTTKTISCVECPLTQLRPNVPGLKSGDLGGVGISG